MAFFLGRQQFMSKRNTECHKWFPRYYLKREILLQSICFLEILDFYGFHRIVNDGELAGDFFVPVRTCFWYGGA